MVKCTLHILCHGLTETVKPPAARMLQFRNLAYMQGVTTKWADDSERQRKDLQSVWVSYRYMQRKLVLVLSLGKKKSTGHWYTHFCVWPFMENFSFCGHFPCGLKFCRCTKRKPMITFLSFHKLQIKLYQLTMNLYSWSPLV